MVVKKTDATDAIVVGSGLAGLVAACELADAGRSVVILDQENRANLGGQAHWSFGGLFFIDSPEQRRFGIRDSLELATSDWMTSAGFDRQEDLWPRKWAKAYLDFAAGEKRRWLNTFGMKFLPYVGWAERGGAGASEHGNSVPRFHITWGTGPGVLAPFVARALEHEKAGRLRFLFRHRVKELIFSDGAVTGCVGEILEPSSEARGVSSSRKIVGDFSLSSQVVLVSSGGIGGNQKLVRERWPTERLGPAPEFMVCGVPQHVDGLLQEAVKAQGASLINGDRMWHYTEGLRNWNPIWPHHGIRVLPGPSSLWLDSNGNRLPFPYYPGADTLGTLKHITTHGHPYTWFVLNAAIIKKEFALSGSEQNPDLTDKSVRKLLARITQGIPSPIQKFMDHGEDFIVKNTLEDLIQGMNERVGNERLNADRVRDLVLDRDRQLQNRNGKDAQLAIAREARKLLSERLVRVTKPAPILDPSDGPLIAVKMNILTRKSLGGLETDLSGRVLGMSGQPLAGLFAAGEVCGFGGGGVHGYRSLEGTFLGGCLFSGRTAGREMAKGLG